MIIGKEENMSNIVLVYKSNTGNTEAMAEKLKSALTDLGAELTYLEASEADKDTLLAADVMVLGCPACGTEELDDEYIEPLMEELAPELGGKKLALFGSYGWGGGEYMETWVSRVEEAGGELVAEPVTVEGEPDDVMGDLEEMAKKIMA